MWKSLILSISSPLGTNSGTHTRRCVYFICCLSESKATGDNQAKSPPSTPEDVSVMCWPPEAPLPLFNRSHLNLARSKVHTLKPLFVCVRPHPTSRYSWRSTRQTSTRWWRSYFNSFPATCSTQTPGRTAAGPAPWWGTLGT